MPTIFKRILPEDWKNLYIYLLFLRGFVLTIFALFSNLWYFKFVSKTVFRIGNLKPRGAGVRVIEGGGVRPLFVVLRPQSESIFKNLKRSRMKKFSHFLVWLMILGVSTISLLSLPTKAQAATTVSAGPSIVAPRFSSPDKTNVYYEGQSIRINVNYGRVGLKVSADLSKLDQTMSHAYPVRDNKTGTYSLTTPLLSGETMNYGSDLAIYFTASDGQTSAKVASTYTVTLKPRPLKGGANIAAPYRLSAKSGDGQANVWWSGLSQAHKVVIKYQGLNGNLRQFQVPATNSGTIIKNLVNGEIYKIEVAGMHRSGTVGSFKEITVKPIGPMVKQIKPAKTVKSIGNGQSVQKPADSEQKEAEKNSEEKSNNWNRLLTAVIILIIAAAAAVGGYYGYGWWVSRRNKEKKSSKSGERW